MPDLTFTIKTPAELAGAEQAARALEVNIGKAKALGKEYGEMQNRLDTINASLKAHRAAQQAAGAGTEQLADETGKATEKTKLFEGHNKELEKVITDLSREFPLAGVALRAFANPIAAVLTVGTGVFVAVKRHVDDLNKSMDELEAKGWEASNGFGQAFQRVQADAGSASREFIKTLQAITGELEAIKQAGNSAVEAIRELETAELERVNADESKAVASINQQETLYRTSGGRRGLSPVAAIDARQKAKNEFESRRRATQSAADQSAIGAKETEWEMTAGELDIAKMFRITLGNPEVLRELANENRKQAERVRQRAASQKFDEGGREVASTDKKGRTLKERISDLDTRRDELWSEFNAADEGGNIRPIVKAEIDKVVAEKDRLQGRLKQMEAQATRYEQRGKDLDREAGAADAANDEIVNLVKRLDDLTAEISRLKAQGALKRQTRDYTGKSAEEVRAMEAEAQKAAAAEAEAKRRAAEQKRLGDDADKQITRPVNGPRADAGAPVPDVAADFTAYHQDNLAALNQLRAAIQQGRRELADSSSRAENWGNA